MNAAVGTVKRNKRAEINFLLVRKISYLTKLLNIPNALILGYMLLFKEFLGLIRHFDQQTCSRIVEETNF